MSDPSRRLLFAATVAATFLTAVPASAQLRGALPGRNLLDRFGLERAWSNHATIDVRSDVVRHMVADEDVVILQTRAGLVTVFDAQSGVRLWDAQLARDNQYSFPAVTNAESMFVMIGTTVYARDKWTGNERWTFRMPTVPSTSPTVDDRRMYVGTLEGSAYAFNLGMIEKIQSEGRLPQYKDETIVWRYNTSGEITTAPVTNGKIVAFASRTGSLYAVSPDSRDLVFQFETDSAPSAPLELLDNDLYYASGDTNLYCLRAQNGTTRWLYVAGAPIREKPHVIGDSVFLVPVGAGMYNLGRETGRASWWSSVVSEFVAATPTRVYGSDQAGHLAVLGREDGALLGTLPLDGFPIRVQNERTDRIFAATTSGLVTCLREKGAEIPIYHRYPERRPLLPLFGDTAPAPGEAAAAETPAEPEEPEEGALPPSPQGE